MTTTTNAQNTTFLQTTVITGDTIRPRVMMTNQASRLCAPDAPWSVADMFSKPIMLEAVEWKGAQPPGTILSQFELPKALISKKSLASQLLRNFVLFKSDFKMRFQLNSTKFHQGTVMFAFNPINSFVSTPISQFSLSGLPNVCLDAAASNFAELNIPFLQLQRFLTTNNTANYDLLGTLYSCVLNKLQVADATTPDVSISIWIEPIDPSLYFPVNDHDPILVVQGKSDAEISNMKGNLVNGVSDLMTGNIPSAAANAAGFAYEATKAIFNLDMPPVPQDHMQVYRSPGNMCTGIGVSNAQRLALNPISARLLSADSVCTVEDEMVISCITSKSMLVSQTSWTSTHTQGAVIYYFPVTPQYCHRTKAAAGVVTMAPTYLSHLSSAFQFWKGSIEVDITIVSAMFQSGSLLVCFTPNQAYDKDFTLEKAAVCPCITIDLQASQKQFSISVPFASSTPWKQTSSNLFALYTDFSSSQPESTLGFVYLIVLNKLVHPVGSSALVDINIYMAGGPDFEVAVPTLPYGVKTTAVPVPPVARSNLVRDERSIPPVPDFEPHERSILDRLRATTTQALRTESMLDHVETPTDTTTEVIALTNGNGLVSDGSIEYFGEGYRHLKDLVRRYGRIAESISRKHRLIQTTVAIQSGNVGYDIEAQNNNQQILSLPFSPSIPARLLADTMTNTNSFDDSFLSHFAKIYVGWSGSLRYNQLFHSSKNMNAMAHAYCNQNDPTIEPAFNVALVTPDTIDPQSLARGAQFTNVAHCPSLSVEVPMYSRYSFLLNRRVGSKIPADTTSGGNVLFKVNASDTLFAQFPVMNKAVPTELQMYAATPKIDFTIFIAAGDDFQFVCLVPPPIFDLKKPA